jgi:transcriptional regulator with XRE-family HTH domain
VATVGTGIDRPGGAADAGGCGCSLTVGRWTGRETLALREALRLSVRGFAAHLGIAVATATKWEDRRRPSPPSLAMQAVLDDALRLADADVRTRFRLMAREPHHDARGGTAETADGGEDSPVTPLRRGYVPPPHYGVARLYSLPSARK